MDNRLKNIVYTLILVGAVAAVYFWRNSGNAELVAFQGKTMGPISYSVKYFDNEGRNFKAEIDSLLADFNNALNTYLPGSEITAFNEGDSIWTFASEYPFRVIDVSRRIYEETEGAYDPTVMPLVNAWGFGPEEAWEPDSMAIDSIRTFVGFDKLSFDERSVVKPDPRIQLDFSASAKGYGVDVVVDYLKEQGIDNIFVEIGGEVRTMGENLETEKPWRIAIIHPESTVENVRQIAIMEVSDNAVATSGNYFNYRVIDGQKFSHTIDPESGYPVARALLSASVIAPTCLEADALATAFMVMGHEKAIEYLESHNQIGGFLIFSTESGLSFYQTEGLAINLLED
ncbi:MAG: FAD:protein FMN transferase [Cyclobacteriaceae bacterium]